MPEAKLVTKKLLESKRKAKWKRRKAKTCFFRVFVFCVFGFALPVLCFFAASVRSVFVFAFCVSCFSPLCFRFRVLVFAFVFRDFAFLGFAF